MSSVMLNSVGAVEELVQHAMVQEGLLSVS